MRLALVLAATLCSCVHASPLASLANSATASIRPSAAQTVANLQAVSVLDRTVARHAPAGEVMAAAGPVALGVAQEALASAPAVAAEVVSAPGPLGWFRGALEAVRSNPALDLVVLLGLVAAFFALNRVFHWLSAKRARQADAVVSGVIAAAEPIAQKTLTPFDDLGIEVLKKIHTELLAIASESPEVAAALADAHESAGAPVPAEIKGA